MQTPAVHLIGDSALVPDLARAADRALAGLPPGTAAVHLREKALAGGGQVRLASALREVTRAHGQLLLVNDRLDVAVLTGADGVHLPSAGVPPRDARSLLGAGALVGVSCHSVDDVRRARAGGADYATFGPVFDTPSKRAYGAPVGLAALAEAARLGLPLVALGGIDLSTAASAREAGASGVAAIRAWLVADDSAAAVRALAGLGQGRRDHGGEMGHGHEGHRGRHGNPEDVDAYVAKMLDPDRDGWQRPDALLAALGVRTGLRVCEIGAGPGYFTARLSRAVGPSGRVTAVEVAPEILARLREHVEPLGNVEVVHGDDGDPRLDPAARFDLVLIVNTFHHFPDGAGYLARLREHLALGGRLVNVDFHPGELPVGPPPEHKVPKEEFVAAARSAGLEVVGEETFLPHQYVLVLAPGRR